jgi:uracil-DNA glycosylase
MENVNKIWLNKFEIYNMKNKENSINKILETIDNKKKYYQLNDLNINIFPKSENLFKCFHYFEPHNTKIVLLGQDPYHNLNQATGLCFGINNTHKIPLSLKNIVKELKNDLNIELKDYTLEKWAKQGILLLNSSLSVIENKPGSQMKLWNDFTDFIINDLNNCDNNIIFVAWGAFAHNKLKNININKHYLIISSHPSPLSVYKKYQNFSAFNNSKPFSKINEILIKNNKDPIDW